MVAITIVVINETNMGKKTSSISIARAIARSELRDMAANAVGVGNGAELFEIDIKDANGNETKTLRQGCTIHLKNVDVLGIFDAFKDILKK